MKKFGKVYLAGTAYTVIEANSSERPEIGDKFGYCDTANREIVVHEGLPGDKFRQTVMHEMKHGLWEESGILDFVANTLGVPRDDEKVRNFEETMHRLEIPHLIEALKSLKKLKP